MQASFQPFGQKQLGPEDSKGLMDRKTRVQQAKSIMSLI